MVGVYRVGSLGWWRPGGGYRGLKVVESNGGGLDLVGSRVCVCGGEV